MVPPDGSPSANGFHIVPELETLVCEEGHIAPFSLPKEALTFEPAPSLVVSPFENGDSERKIHCNIKLQDEEQNNLIAMQREANLQDLKFSPSITAMATRFLGHSRMDVKKALKCMQATQEWRTGFFRDGPVTDSSVLEDLRHGIVYFTGRDSEMRPTLVVRGSRIPSQWYKEKRVDRLIRLLVFCMEYMMRYMLVPGRVENLSVIVDLKGVGLSQVSVGALGDVYKVMSHHYSGRVFRFYIAHLPTCLSMIAGMAKALLTDRQKQKLIVLRDVKELKKYFALHQLEEDLGGSRPCATEFYPFPLQAGPFASGYTGGADPAAVPYVHRALTAVSAMGRLWDPEKSYEDNVCIEFSPEAEPILERCGVSLSPSPNASTEASSLRLQCGESIGQGEPLDRRVSSCSSQSMRSLLPVAKDATAASTVCTEGSSIECTEHIIATIDRDVWELDDAAPKIEASEVMSPGGLFGCLVCFQDVAVTVPPRGLSRTVSL